MDFKKKRTESLLAADIWTGFFLVPVVFPNGMCGFFPSLLKCGAFQSVELSFSAACVQEPVGKPST